MVKFFAKLFIKDYQHVENSRVRTAYGTMCALFGIITNFIICVGKVIIGTIIGSISITADGINNLTDSASSVVTLVGFKLASKPADDKHPYGHERIEYLNSLIIAFVILAIGIALGYSSFDKILNPASEDLSFFTIAVLILGGSILIKVWQLMFYNKTAKLINSLALKATAQDSLSDILSTSVVLVSLLVNYFFDVKIDGYIGLAVAILIVFNAIKLVKEATSPIIGEAPDNEFVKKVSDKILSYEGVLGIHDFVIHSYGASKTFITAHVEVDSNVNVLVSHEMIDTIEHDFLENDNINLVIHMDPIEISDPETLEMKEFVGKCVSEISDELTFHDFRMVKGEHHSNLIFDIVVPFKFKLRNDEIKQIIQEKVTEYNSKYIIVINFDVKYA